MHQVSLETICPLKTFQLHYCPAKNAKSMVKHFIFLHKFSVISKDLCLFIPRKCHFTSALLEPIDLGRVDWKKTVSVSNSPILTLSRELLWCELLSLNAYGIFLLPSQYFVIESSHLCWSCSVICLLRNTYSVWINTIYMDRKKDGKCACTSQTEEVVSMIAFIWVVNVTLR